MPLYSPGSAVMSQRPGSLWGSAWRLGPSGPYDPASDAIFAAFTTPPTSARKTLIDNCVRALKTAGVWSKLDALYAFAAADSQAALINWKAPGTYNGTLVNAPAFAVDHGFTGGSTKYIDSGFDPSVAPSPKYLQDSACVFGWASTDVPSGVSGGLLGNANEMQTVIPKDTDGNYYLRVNIWPSFIVGVSPGVLGLWCATRVASNSTNGYKNGVLIGTGGGISQALASYTSQFLKYSAAGYWTGEIAAGGFGAGLTAGDNTALYNALNAYMVGVALRGWWKFDDGTAIDSSGRGNNGTLINSPVSVPGIIGNALQFNGSTQYVDVGSSASINTPVFTYSVWVKITDYSNYYILINNTTNGPHWRINPSTGYMELDVQGVVAIYVTNHAVPLNTWVHLATSYDAAGNWAVYINGVLDASGTNLQSFGFGSTGIAGGFSGFYFKGLMDDVRIYNRVLSAVEIAAIYSGG